MDNREITSHAKGECNSKIEVVASRKGAGGAATRYDVFGPRKQMGGAGLVPSFGLNMKFQDGPLAEGINGLTNEVLLAILEDRLVGFQSGPFACEANAHALAHVRAALEILHARTTERSGRGVEGKHEA